MSIEYENKVKNYLRMLENETRYITATPEDWLKFLHTSCNNYKLDFRELVLVNTTFPNATALLQLKDWNSKFGRKVKKQETGIPSLDFTQGKRIRVKYYFDISQTVETENSKPVPLWRYNNKHESNVVKALNSKFNLKCSNFETAISGAINKLTLISLDSNYNYLQKVYNNTPLVKFGATAKKIYGDMIAKSAMAVVVSRCGYDITKLFNANDFQDVTMFDSSKTTLALGSATLNTAKEILNVISYTINKEIEKEKSYERNKENSQWNRLYSGRGRDLVSGPSTSGVRVEQLGSSKERLLEEQRRDAIRRNDDDGRDSSAPRNSSNSGSGEVQNIDRAEEESIGSNRGTQGERLAQVGTISQQHSGGSSSGSSRRNDLHLNEENLKSNTEAEVIDNSSAFSISQEQINKIITEGSGVVNGKYRIYEQFAKDETLKDNAQFLKNEYGIGGKSSAATYNHIGVDWDGKGLLLANKNTENKILLKWEKVAKIISYLIKTDGYLNSAEKQGYIDYKKAKELPAEKQKEAEIPAEELELAYSVGKKCYIGADEYKIIGITDNAVSLFDSRYPLLSTDMSKEEFEKKITENRQFNEHLFVKKLLDKDLFFNNLDKESFTYIYYNPDADSGGQFVITEIPYEQVIEASKKYPDNTSEFFDYIVSVGRQTAVDVDSEFFRDSLDKYNSNSHFAEGLTDDVKNQLTNIALSGDTNFKQKDYYDSYSEIQSENPDAIILFRVGDFYEVLGDNAQEAAEALNLTLMSRTINGEKIPMVGFPSSYLEDNENLLVEIGYKILTVEPEDVAERASLRNKAQEVAKQNNLPFYDKFSMGFEDDFDMAVYDGSMSADDYEKLQQADIEPKADRPTITCDWSEHSAFEDGKTYSVADFDRIMKSADDEWVRLRQYEQDTYGNDMDAIYQAYEDGEIDSVHQGYAKTKFIINMPDGTRYTERQDIGDGDGGVIDFLRQYDNYKNLVPILEQERDNEPSLLTPVYGEEFVKEVEEQSDNLSAQQKREDVIFSSDGKNYVITDDNFADGTKSERYANNINAIKTLKEIESSNRQATPAEQEILAKYVGWGGLDSYFKAENNAQLKALLNDDEYKAALASTLTSFYTPPAVIRAVYNALNNLGFKTGNILEPSCGVGNFMGLCPTNMSDSKFYGVELDDISGRIASKLYPQANIAVQGFETTNLPDNFFDAAVGNVPFAQLKVLDKKYDKYNFLIHDYFFAKTLDKVRPGGIIAFITSKGTMDKKSSKVRKYIAQRAELLGAIRLPNDTFSKTAGTEVTSDILILKKRERMIDIEPDWVHLGKDDNGITINSYFVEHPEMILGEMQEVSGPFGAKAECIAYENANLEDLLNEAVSNIDGEYKAQAIEKLFEDTEDDEDADLIPATPDVKNFSYTVVDGDIYYRQNSVMEKQKVNKTAEKRIKALVKVREALREVLNNQLEDMPDEIIANSQRKLNVIYDRFVNEYGYINSKANMKAFEKDNSINLLASLEKFDSEKNYKGKSDIFSKRTIQPHKAVDKVDTASDALAVSISEKAKIDLEYMSQLYGKSVDDIIDELEGVIFNVPGTDIYQTADEYLSGNVREKLRTALSYSYDKPEQYDCNITALKAVQPVDLTATEIDVRLGATWLPVDVVRDFMYETFGTSRYIRDSIDVSYSEYNSEWRISHKSLDKSVNAVSTYGTKRINAYKILEDTLNLRDVKIFDNIFENGKEKRVLNKEETAIAQSKQELIKSRFASWIFSDRDRRERLCRLYNEKFNSVRPREYDGSHLIFDGMNSEIQLREHQRNAVAHAIYGGNTLLAHTVGAGKTFEMVAIAMESKRLGLCNKSLFVVPNHITEQMGIEFMQLYPAANILVATKKDFETANRKKFCSRIATGDYDAVIIGHSQFEKIPMSIERQRQIIEMQIDDVIESITFAQDNNAENFTIKQLEKMKKNLENKLQKLNDQSRKDDVVIFEELGVDRLFVDEAHYYKNLFLYTKMRNVAGVSQTEAQKSSDLFMKCRYLDEITDGKGVVFATGTPISNSMTELYTMQRYLQYNKLVDLGLSNFDAWASTFGETVTALELSPEGNGYRMKTRFAKFFNLPELMSTFREIADIKTADVLDLDVPEVERHNVLTKPSEQQKEIIAGIGDRADKVHSGDVDPSVDNMLKITNDGRKLALDQRLINPMLPDFEGSKLNVCADNIFSLWDKTKEDRLAQMVFCDISTPNGAGKFNVYDELKTKLIAKGIPENEIAFIHDAKTNQQKQDIFSQVRSGKIRVIIGSTSKMGAGTNCQDKLIALHHLDCPWRPSDLQQREGRIIRQGNKNSLVHIYSYLTENTFDAYLYQLVENKQKFISQIMTSKSPVRSAEDIDELQLSYAVAKALCSGNPLIKEKMDLDIEVSKLQLLKANFLSVKYDLEDKIASTYPQQINNAKYKIDKIKNDIELAQSHITDDFELKIKGITYNDKKEAGQQLLLACDKSIGSDKVRIGEYKGFILDLRFDAYHSNKYFLTLNGSAHYDVELGQDIFGNVTRIDNVLKSLPGELEKAKNELSKVESDYDSAKEAVNTTFDKEEELNTKLARLKELNTILEVDNSSIKKNEDTADNNEDEYYYAKVNEKQKDILFSEGYKDFAPSDDGGKFIVKYPAADKVKVQQLLNNNAIKL